MHTNIKSQCIHHFQELLTIQECTVLTEVKEQEPQMCRGETLHNVILKLRQDKWSASWYGYP